LRYLRKAGLVRNETFYMQHVALGSISSISFHKQTISLCDPIQALQCRFVNLLRPNDIYIGRTAALTSIRYILNIYATNIHTEYFKHGA